MGEGFFRHPTNEALRRDLQSGALRVNDPARNGYFEQPLHLVYRCIFLFKVEERGILHTGGDDPGTLAARRIYAEGYALGRLKERCRRRAGYDHYDDLWQGLRIVFRGLAKGEPRLVLPALGGLFDPRQCPDLGSASLPNHALLTAMRHPRWTDRAGGLWQHGSRGGSRQRQCAQEDGQLLHAG